ncbi:MAG: HK97 gp10 family phage protein [Lentisphaerota bacterium]
MADEVFRFDTSQLKDGIRRLINESEAKKKRAMLNIASYLEKEVKDAAPIDEGNLTNDIHGSVQESEGVTAAVISVAANAPSSRYAVVMHENNYNLGKLSLAKMAKTGKPVGKKYIINPIMLSGRKIVDIITSICKL